MGTLAQGFCEAHVGRLVWGNYLPETCILEHGTPNKTHEDSCLWKEGCSGFQDCSEEGHLQTNVAPHRPYILKEPPKNLSDVLGTLHTPQNPKP